MSNKNCGFTILEISIVFVIIGLIVGGVVVGQSLIRGAQLQSIISDEEAYKKAVLTFQDKYKSLPGDLATATSLWGAAVGCPTIAATNTPTTTTCNGNGDSYIADPLGSTPMELSTNTGEHMWLWQHLANAELIPGKYTGTDALGSYVYKPGVNLPASRVDGATFTFSYAADSSDTASFFTGNYRHIIVFGKPSEGKPLNNTVTAYQPAITGSEALLADQKVDDGKPHMGIVRSFNTGISDGPTQCVDGTPVYRTDLGSTLNCSLIFITGY